LVEKGGIGKITLRKKNVIFSIQKNINILLQEVKSKHVGVEIQGEMQKNVIKVDCLEMGR
jgi:hypothetical protein